jgi:hypothetical protein
MIKDFGAEIAVLGGGGARGVAAGTGDNTKANGEIVDNQARPGGRPISGVIFVVGSAVLADTKSISINDLYIEHGAVSNLSDAAEYTFGSASTDYTNVKTSTGGTTETFGIKQNVDLTGLKRYWRVTCKPDLDATGTDTFEIGFGCACISEYAPVASED